MIEKEYRKNRSWLAHYRTIRTRLVGDQRVMEELRGQSDSAEVRAEDVQFCGKKAMLCLPQGIASLF
jgi:hypothetical protein